MASLIQPLSSQVPIVDSEGKPLPTFITMLQKLGVGTGLDASSSGMISLAAMAAKTILANKTAGVAAPTACTISDILDFVSSTRGTVLFRGAAGWQGLAPGTSGNLLQTNGAGADPTWVTPPAGGGGSGGFNGLLTATVPDPASFTLSGSNPVGTTTAYTAGQFGNLTIPAGVATSAKYTKAPLPSAPYNLYCAVSLNGDTTTGNDFSFGFFDASNNFVRRIRQTMINPTYRWGVSTGAGDLKLLSGAQNFGTNAVMFMRIQNDGTNVKYYFSMDNAATWMLFYSEVVAGISTATKWGFWLANSSTTSTLGVTYWAMYIV